MGQRAGPHVLIIKPRLTLMDAGNPSDKLVSKHSGSKGQYSHQLSPNQKEWTSKVIIASHHTDF